MNTLMKAAATVWMVVGAASLHARDRVVVCVEDDDVIQRDVLSHEVLWHAEAVASRMFAGIGVSVEWIPGKPPLRRPTGACSTRLVEVRLVVRSPEGGSPGRLGYAELSSRFPGRAVIPVDRLNHAVPPDWLPYVMGYVLAHEVTHVLQGVARHSETGVMKARWTFADYTRMVSGKLEFAPLDASIIHIRLAEGCGVMQVATR